jgi:hypothetical protein
MKLTTKLASLTFSVVIALVGVGSCGSASAQNPEMQEKVAAVKAAMAANKQALAQYTWVEQDTISLKGEQKKQEHFQVVQGPDGKPQKTSIDPPPQESGREGRLKKRIVEKKTEEYEEYGNQIKALIKQYVPPDKDLIQQAQQNGNLMLGPEGGDMKLMISNYLKPGDNMTLIVDKMAMGLKSLSISTYLNDPSDAVTVSAQFTRIPGGPNHISTETINGVSKQLTIAIQNSNYQHQ